MGAGVRLTTRKKETMFRRKRMSESKRMLTTIEYHRMMATNYKGHTIPDQDYSVAEKIRMTAEAINRGDIADAILHAKMAKEKALLDLQNARSDSERLRLERAATGERIRQLELRVIQLRAEADFCWHMHYKELAAKQKRISSKGGRKTRTRLDAKDALAHVETCSYCGINFDGSVAIHYDHVEPVSNGGEDSLDNLVKSCAPCNLAKGTKSWVPLKGTEYASGRLETRDGSGNPWPKHRRLTTPVVPTCVG